MDKKSFLDNYPRLKKEWYYELNNNLKLFPENLSYGSNRKVWWRCVLKFHIWQAAIKHRTYREYNCPYCSGQKLCEDGSNSLFAVASEELKQEWNEEKNGSMKLYSPKSGKKVWWKCIKCLYEWEAAIGNRTGNCSGCPYCSGNKLREDGSTSLYIYASEQLKYEWNEEKNGSMKLYAPNSGLKVWWKCKYGHEWQTLINNRTRSDKNGTNCPYCSHYKLCEDGSNTLESKATERMKKEWMEEKNGSMRLYTIYSKKKTWWKCIEEGHEWQAVPSNRYKANCPYCRQYKLEAEFHKVCEVLQIDYTKQAKYEDVRDTFILPYDASINYKNKETRLEFQGNQHYMSDNYYHKKHRKNSPTEEYFNRLNKDNKKSYSTLKAGHNFLSISYLCAGEISTVLSRYLEDLENYDILLRYHITPYIYLQYSESNGLKILDTEMCCEYTDEMMIIYRIYLYQINSLQNPTEVTEKDFTECCGKLYFNDTIDEHKNLIKHEEN